MEAEKQLILDQIKASRAGIRVVNSCITTFPDLTDICQSIMRLEQINIQEYFNQLVELERNNQ